MKKTILIIFILFYEFCHSQSNVPISYYHNDKSVKLENLAVSIVTENDTVQIKTAKTKIKFPKIEKAFTLLINANGERFIFGLVDPEVLDNNLEIIVGKIDAMEKLKQSNVEPTAYYLRDKYLIHIDDPNSKELYFITLLQNKKLGEKLFAVKQSGLSRIIK